MNTLKEEIEEILVKSGRGGKRVNKVVEELLTLFTKEREKWLKNMTLLAQPFIKARIMYEIDKEKESWLKQLKINIGCLRQYLNERNSKELITNKELELWILDNLLKSKI